MSPTGKGGLVDRVGCLALVAHHGQEIAVLATLHQNPPPEIASGVLAMYLALAQPGVTVQLYELAECAHCALGSRDLAVQRVWIERGPGGQVN